MNGNAIGQTIAFGVGVALSPFPIVGVVLMLETPRARSNSLAFLGGWIVGLAAVGTIVLLVASGAGATSQGAPADWVSVVKLILGALLIVVAVRQWSGHSRASGDPSTPKWMQAIDAFTPPKAAGLGVLLSAANPKNLLLAVGAAAAIAQTGAPAGGQAVALAVFVLIGTLGPAAPVLVYFALGARAEKVLTEVKTWMVANNGVIIAVLALVIGAKLIGDGISGLAA